MGVVTEIISRTNIANIVAGVVVVVTTAYATYSGNDELLRTLALITAGYLFGATRPRGGGNGQG